MLEAKRDKTAKKEEKKSNGKVIKIVLTAMLAITGAVGFARAGTEKILKPEDNQYLELRATSITENEEGNKQLIMELWGHNLEFKGFSFRFSYDSSKYKLSNVETNEITDNCDEYFKFENEFSDVLEFFDVTYKGIGDGLEAVVSFNPPTGTKDYILEKEDVGKVIHTRRFNSIWKIKL